MSNYSNIDNSPDFIYYDTTVSSFNLPGSQELGPFTYTDQNNSNLIEDCSKYYMSIIRFSADTAKLPVWQCPTQPSNTASVNDTILYITFNYIVAGVTTTTITQNIIWVPLNDNIPVPQAPTNVFIQASQSNNYYYCYDYHYITKLINTCLSTLMANMIIAQPGLALVNTPISDWDDNRNCLNFYFQKDTFDTTSSTCIEVWFSRSLYGYFPSFPIKKISNDFSSLALNNFANYQLNNDAVYLNVLGPTESPFGIDDAILTTQEYQSLANLSPISSFTFCTMTIPIIGNRLASPSYFLNNQLVDLNATSNQAFNIISDISTDEFSFRPSLLYTSDTPRYISLVNSQIPVKQIDIRLFWRDKAGFLHPFIQGDTGNMSIKLLFKKKTANF